MASRSGSAGGRAEAAGGGYETLVAAWYCVRILLGRIAHPLFDLSANTRVVALRCQSGEEVDDANCRTSDNGVILVQVKRSVGLTTGETSPLAKALDQFVRQQKAASEHASEAIRGRGLDPVRDRLVLATRSTAPGKIKGALTRLLRGLRDTLVNASYFISGYSRLCLFICIGCSPGSRPGCRGRKITRSRGGRGAIAGSERMSKPGPGSIGRT